MAKSKYQKQQEAIERKRKNFPKVINHWCERQKGGEWYETCKAAFDEAEADLHAREAEKYLLRMAAEARVDRYGNPLEKYEPASSHIWANDSSAIKMN